MNRTTRNFWGIALKRGTQHLIDVFCGDQSVGIVQIRTRRGRVTYEFQGRDGQRARSGQRVDIRRAVRKYVS